MGPVWGWWPAVSLLEQRQLRAGVGFPAAADDPRVGEQPLQLVSGWMLAQQRGEFHHAASVSGHAAPSWSSTACQAWTGTRPIAARYVRRCPSRCCSAPAAERSLGSCADEVL